MSAAVTIAVALIGALGTVTVGYLTLRSTVRATAAKEKADENATALAAWRELVQPLRDEVTRLHHQLEDERAEHTAVLGALSKQNEELHRKLRREGK